MKKIVKLLILFFSLIILITVFGPEDKAWVDCSDEKDLYRYVSNGWKVDKVLKKGEITYSDTGSKLYYMGEKPQIFLSKKNKIKILNFGWRCYYLEGKELNLTKK